MGAKETGPKGYPTRMSTVTMTSAIIQKLLRRASCLPGKAGVKEEIGGFQGSGAFE